MPLLDDDYRPDLDREGSRFTHRAAFGVAVGDYDVWGGDADAVVRARFGDWIVDERDEELGEAKVVEGSFGRGAEAWGAVVEFIAVHAAGGVIATAAGLAFKRMLDRARDALRDRGSSRDSLDVSRGAAALLAAAEVAVRFGVEGDLEIEAVEEPSTLAGQRVIETSYTGFEPWLVLLRDAQRRRRYYIVVEPHGTVSGAIETTISDGDALHAVPLGETSWANPPRGRRRDHRRGFFRRR